MKQILKKNQIIISVIAIMLIAAGYMNYTSNEKQALETAVLTDSEKYAGIGDATLVSANVADNNDLVNNDETQNTDNENNDTSKNEDKKDEIKSNEQNTETTENAVQNEINTSTTVTENSGNQYFAELRLERDKMYSQMLESYQKILSNSQISETQKEISENEIKKINTKVAEVEIEVNPENVNNVVGHKKENIQKLKDLYEVDVKVKQSFNVKPGKFNINIIKTYKDFLDDE